MFRRGSRLALVVLLASAALAASAAALPQYDARLDDAARLRPYVIDGITTREQRSELVRQGYDIEAVYPTSVVVVATAAERAALERDGFSLSEATMRDPFAGSPEIGPDGFPAADSGYHDYAEMRAELQRLAAAHPESVHLFSLGFSYEGRELLGARVSDDATDRTDEPGVLFVGLHHAREHMTVEVVLSLVQLFAESTDPTIRSLAQTRQIYLVPSLNPDGGEYDVASGSYAYWRKNRQPSGGTFYVGTDLNRNYAYGWGCCGGSSGSPSSETYRGWQPFSSPETSRLRDFVDVHPNVHAALSYHTYGGLILYPYGYTYEDVPADMASSDHAALVAIAREMARTTGYVPEQSSDLYITDGDFNDWLYGAKRVYPFTFELADSGYGFYPPDELIGPESTKNHAAAVYLAQVADCPASVVGAACSTPPPPPPASGEVATPSATVVQTGSPRAGAASDLAADDDRYFEVNSTVSWSPTSAWYGRLTGVPNELKTLKVSYKGKNSRTCTQTVSIWRWTTSTWVQLDSRAIGAETPILDLTPSGVLGDYVSGASGPGETRVRVRCSGGRGSFYSSGNLLRLDFTR